MPRARGLRCEFGLPRLPRESKSIRIEPKGDSAWFLLSRSCGFAIPAGAFDQKWRRRGPAPVLLARPGSTRAIAFESVTQTVEPFAPTRALDFSLNGDRRTRVMLFATNLTLLAGDGPSAVTADGEDAAHVHYPMTVEHVSPVPGFAWMTAVVIRLHDNLGDTGDMLVGITYQGTTSNRVRVGIGHIGGGPPDDPAPSPTPTPGATPELGPGASLHGKRFFPPTIPGTRTSRRCRSIQTRQPDRQHRLEYRTASRLRHRLQRRAQWHSLCRRRRNAIASADQLRAMATKAIRVLTRCRRTHRLKVVQIRMAIVMCW